eukprot:CAMPEP_0179015066 /NCGR_PEP_ID=MMETSP0796-20121207/2594_1 /TAXON_ID=73915 /ORGANISM="Pyrodinium bahamense, Strain pbaha01" /LENGTH=88 /DNA_ID=CAMNT_0020710677 /DNA_START=862 /DNA_END=1126 /DNA_ORIENTATION=-
MSSKKVIASDWSLWSSGMIEPWPPYRKGTPPSITCITQAVQPNYSTLLTIARCCLSGNMRNPASSRAMSIEAQVAAEDCRKAKHSGKK